MERTYKTIIQGIRDYFRKCGLSKAVLGLSGGLDQAKNTITDAFSSIMNNNNNAIVNDVSADIEDKSDEEDYLP